MMSREPHASIVPLRRAIGARSKRAALFGAAIALAMGASSAKAQQERWNDYCTLGPTPLCMNIELNLTQVEGSTDVSIRLQNLEGYLGSTPWALYNVFFNLDNDVTSGLDAFPIFQASLLGSAQFLVTATPAQCATFPQLQSGCPGPTWGETEWDWNATGTGTGQIGSHIDELPRPFGIVGCDAPSQPSMETTSYWGAGFFQTCGDGSVAYNFSVLGDWVFDSQSSVDVVTFDGSNFGGCTLGATCQQVTTPEPATIVLLATGLILLCGVAQWRRRVALD